MQARVHSHSVQSIATDRIWFSPSRSTQASISVTPKHIRAVNRLLSLSTIAERLVQWSTTINGKDLSNMNTALNTLIKSMDDALRQTAAAPDIPQPVPIPASIQSAISSWTDSQNQSVTDLLPSMTLFYNQLPITMRDTILDALLRAELQHDDSLMSFLDHEIAIRGSLTNDSAVYLPDSADIMADHHAFFNIISLDPLDALSTQDQSQSSTKQHYERQHSLNGIDFILFELLLEEELPLGLIRFRLTPNLKHSNANQCVLDLVLYHKQSILTEFRIQYANQANIWVTRGGIPFAHLNLNLKSGRVYRINGHIQNKAFLCHYSRSNTAQLKLSISQWRTTLAFKKNNRDLIGTWKKPNGDQKLFQLRGQRTLVGGHMHQSYRAQLGEDAIQAVYQFHKSGKTISPLPLGGTGAILNNAFTPKQAITLPYPVWALGI